MSAYCVSIIVLEILSKNITPIFGGYFLERNQAEIKASELLEKMKNKMLEDGLLQEHIDTNYEFDMHITELKINIPLIETNADQKEKVETVDSDDE